MGNRGLFIASEGLNGTGKTETGKRLVEAWNRNFPDQRMDYVKQPSSRINYADLIDGEIPYGIATTDRAEIMREEIEPRLSSGIHVYSDRSYISTAAYSAQTLAEFWSLLKHQAHTFQCPDVHIFFSKRLMPSVHSLADLTNNRRIRPTQTLAEFVEALVPKMREAEQKVSPWIHMRRAEMYELVADRMGSFGGMPLIVCSPPSISKENTDFVMSNILNELSYWTQKRETLTSEPTVRIRALIEVLQRAGAF